MKKGRIRNNIRKLRFNSGEMTQQDLADRIGVTRQTVIAIEREKYSPSLNAAFRIARVFDVPLQEVFQYEPEPSGNSAGAADVPAAGDVSANEGQSAAPPMAETWE